MTRRYLAVEGERTFDGRLIEPRALGWRDRIAILLSGLPFPLPVVVGQVDDIRREDDGWITGEVTFYNPALVDETNLALGVNLFPATTRPSEDARTMVFTQGFIHDINVIEPAARPWAKAGLEVPS